MRWFNQLSSCVTQNLTHIQCIPVVPFVMNPLMNEKLNVSPFRTQSVISFLFLLFQKALDEDPNLVSSVTGFTDSIRKCMSIFRIIYYCKKSLPKSYAFTLFSLKSSQHPHAVSSEPSPKYFVFSTKFKWLALLLLINYYCI